MVGPYPTQSPDPSSVLGGGATPPDPSQTQTTTPPPNPNPAPAQPDKHQVLGRFVSHVTNALEGKRTTYVPDRTPDGNLTGQVKEVPVPRKPGGFFRDLLGGMMAGMAASATAGNANPSGAAGLGLGFIGARNAAQADDSRIKNRAVERATGQKNAQDQEAAQASADQVAKGSIAANFMNSLDFGHHVGQHSDDDVDSHNRSVDVVRRTALDNGGALAQIDHNGEPGNGPALMEAYNKDPQSVMQAPDGFHRIPTITYDTNGLVHKGGKWTNQDGSQLDDDEWNKRATVSLIDLPNSAWGKRITLTKGAANDVAGRTLAQGNPTDSVSTDFGSLFGLGLRNLSQMNKDRQALTARPKNDAEYKGDKAKLDALRAKPDEELSDEERRFIDVRGPIIDKYKPKEQAPTGTQVKLDTERIEKSLADGTITQPDRATLVQRQKADPNRNKGVPADIIASIGDRPVPAEYRLGENDPAYKLANKMWGNASLDKKKALAEASGIARMQEMGRMRVENYIDTKDNKLVSMNAVDFNKNNNSDPGRFVRATNDGTKVASRSATIDDIQTNINNTRQAIANLDNFDAKTRVKLAVALRDSDPASALDSFLQSEAGQALSDQEQTAVIGLRSMAENVMAIRGLQGVSGGSSDLAKRAMLEIVPSGKTPSKGYADKQFNILQRTMDQIKKGIPVVGTEGPQRVQPTVPVDENAKPIKFDSSKLTNLHTNGSVTIGWDGKQYVDAKTGTPYTGK